MVLQRLLGQNKNTDSENFQSRYLEEEGYESTLSFKGISHAYKYRFCISNVKATKSL